MHRIIMERVLGRQLKPRELVDHINGDALDNRRSNLRLASQAQNLMNRGKTNINTSGYKGVSWRECNHKWRAVIGVNGKSIHLGYFATAEEAYEAYKEATKKYHGEFARAEWK